MSVLLRVQDGLKNLVANLGTARDKSSHSFYVTELIPAHQLLDMYRSSWLARAICEYPAEDATRKWRQWRAEADQITKIEKLERDLCLQRRVQDALVAARLYGGAAIYINTQDSGQDTPLQPGSGSEIKSLVVLTNNTLNAGEIVRDINSPYYGNPEFYTLSNRRDGTRIRIHASRLVIFRGASIPDDSMASAHINRWGGDSILQSTLEAVRNMDATMANIASLVFEAKVDVFKFEGFAQMMASNQDDVVLRRARLNATMKGINGSVVIDAEDDYEQKSATFSGLPEIVSKFQDSVAGAAGIPVTRLYGRSAAGLSGTGEGDERVYYDRIGHDQTNEIQPAMSLLDDCLIYQALGSRPDEIYFEWVPLKQLTEAERADIFQKTASAARSLAGNNVGEIIPLDALSDSLTNELTEQGVLPGLDQAILKYGTLAEQSDFVGGADEASDFLDAAPRTLYVSRKVINASEILKHYEKQGVKNLIAPGDMHVTITYSRQPVDWMKMEVGWSETIDVNAGGPRVMELFGPEKDTAVLSFISNDLIYRHERMLELGASWDWPDYQPHISISYDFDGDIDNIDSWQGVIKLGPEIFEEINENWKDE